MPEIKNTVIITGSSGFVGKALIEKLAGKFNLVGFDREHAPHPPVAAECVCIDVTSDEIVSMALERVRVAYGRKIASVIHLAAYFDLSGESNPRHEAVTVRGIERLLKGLEASDVEQFVFMSTMLVHAPSGHQRKIDEDSPLDDRFPYRASKIRTEAMLREQHGEVPLVLLRPAGVYDDLCHNAFLARQVARVFEKRLTAYVYPGDLHAGQPYLHLDDLTDAVLHVVERLKELAAETTLLLAESDVLAFGTIQTTVARLTHDEDLEILSIPKALASTGAWVQDKVLNEDPFIRPYMVQMSAMAEIVRPLRFVNVAFGSWLVVAPWVLDGASTFASWVGVVIGIAVMALSLPRGKRSAEHYGDWDRYVV